VLCEIGMSVVSSFALDFCLVVVVLTLDRSVLVSALVEANWGSVGGCCSLELELAACVEWIGSKSI